MTRVLIIQPDPAERDRMALALRRAGLGVRSAADALAGIQAAEEWRPEVAIVPLDGAHSGGTSVVASLRAHRSSAPLEIIALLPPGEVDARMALLAGADDALPACPSEAALLEAVAVRASRAAHRAGACGEHDHAASLLTAALRRAERPVAVALVALQGADSLNAVEGPEALQTFEHAWLQRVRALAPDALAVASIGPGEAVLVLPPSTPQVRALLAALAGTGQMPIRAGRALLRARSALGVTTLERNAPLPELTVVLARCRVALRRALLQGFPQVHTFQEFQAEGELDDFELAAHLQHAVEAGRFQLAYLPKVCMASGGVLGVEALIRWNMPTGESVPPERLLAVADEAGLLDEVGTWALREACRQAAHWTQAGLRLPVSVNISAGQFRRGDLVDETRMALSEAGLQGEQLTVEVSERALARDTSSVRDQLAEVRVAGARVSIEDVGGGALALSTLRSLPLDELKIDQSLVARLPGNGQDRAAVDLVLREAHALGVRCVAEGVEHAAQWAYLAEHGWPAAQGWLVSRPLAPEAVPDFCARAEGAFPLSDRPTPA